VTSRLGKGKSLTFSYSVGRQIFRQSYHAVNISDRLDSHKQHPHILYHAPQKLSVSAVQTSRLDRYTDRQAFRHANRRGAISTTSGQSGCPNQTRTKDVQPFSRLTDVQTVRYTQRKDIYIEHRAGTAARLASWRKMTQPGEFCW
jgi:hypothetical protein